MTRYVLDARTATDHFPGIGRYIVNLARAIIPLLDHDEQLVLLRDPAKPSAFNLDTLAGSQVDVIDISISPFAVRQQWVIYGMLRRLKADIYHSPYYLMPYRLPTPTLLTVYDLIPLLYPHYFSRRTRLIFKWATTLAIRAATQITTISQATRHDLLTHYHPSPDKVTAIPLAADPNFCPVSADTIANLRARLKLPEDYVLYVGSNKPHKNLVRLIEAWATIQPQPTSLVIAGVWDSRHPDSYQRMKQLNLSGTVHFLGPVAEADLPALYSGATMFIFPSEYEGFGLPVLEAMACGVPVACANTSSLPQVAGDAALLFEPTDTASMAEVLHRLLNDVNLRANLRQRGLCRAEQFSWQQTAQETLALYRKMGLATPILKS